MTFLLLLQFAMRSPSPTRDQQRMANTLELRMKEHDYETETLTEHQRRNRDVMSRKMAEMSKLQNVLTNQAKVWTFSFRFFFLNRCVKIFNTKCWLSKLVNFVCKAGGLMGRIVFGYCKSQDVVPKVFISSDVDDLL